MNSAGIPGDVETGFIKFPIGEMIFHVFFAVELNWASADQIWKWKQLKNHEKHLVVATKIILKLVFMDDKKTRIVKALQKVVFFNESVKK